MIVPNWKIAMKQRLHDSAFLNLSFRPLQTKARG
jgi:hypothetical protein